MIGRLLAVTMIVLGTFALCLSYRYWQIGDDLATQLTSCTEMLKP